MLAHAFVPHCDYHPVPMLVSEAEHHDCNDNFCHQSDAQHHAHDGEYGCLLQHVYVIVSSDDKNITLPDFSVTIDMFAEYTDSSFLHNNYAFSLLKYRQYLPPNCYTFTNSCFALRAPPVCWFIFLIEQFGFDVPNITLITYYKIS